MAGTARPGRMFYGIRPGQPFAPKRPAPVEIKSPGDELIDKYLKKTETEVGLANVSDDAAIATSQAGKAAARKEIEDIIEPAKRSAYRILQKIGLAPRLDTRGSVGYHTRYNQQMKNDNPDGISAKLLAEDLRDSRYDSFAVLRKQVDEWNSLNPKDTLDANKIIDKFLKSLDDLGDAKVWDTIGPNPSQRLYRRAIGNRKFIDEIDRPYVQDASYSVPSAVSSLSSSGYVQKPLNTARNQKVKVKVDDRAGSATRGEVVLFRVRDKKIEVKDPVTGKTVLQDDIISEEVLSLRPGEFIKDQSGKANIWVNDEVEGLVNLRGMQGEVGRAGSINPALGYKGVEVDNIPGVDIQFAHANKGGMIPGVQYRNPGGEIFESGGRSVVPGVGNKDTVPAMLTPGEFVVNKDATRKHKEELKAINSGQQLNIGGRVKGIQFLNAGDPVRASALPEGQKPTF